MITIRPETPADHVAVYEVNRRAFGQAAEADLVERLRREASPYVSLVAEAGEQVVGHIFFSPVEVESGDRSLTVMGLAPMAITPEWQRQDIGSRLVREGLRVCRQQGVQAVVVLGHPEYYPRFGFQPAEGFGLQSEYDVPAEAFMAMELEPGALEGVRGVVRYHVAFAAVG